MKKFINRRSAIRATFKLALITFVLVLFGAVNSFACSISMKVIDNSKDKYEIGDIVTVKTTVKTTHRSCPEDINKTKFNPKGVEILNATKWSEVSGGVWERKLKVKVTGTTKGKVTLSAVRSCNKDGGVGSITLEAEPIK